MTATPDSATPDRPTPESATAATAAAEADALWVDSYQGEVLGESYFGRMAELATEPAQRHKLDVLTRLERSTRELLVPYLERHGLPTVPDASTVAAVCAQDHLDWDAMLSGIGPVTAEFLAKYRRLGELADPADRPAVDALIAHEQALEEFTRRELAGDGAGSLDAILALPHLR